MEKGNSADISEELKALEEVLIWESFTRSRAIKVVKALPLGERIVGKILRVLGDAEETEPVSSVVKNLEDKIEAIPDWVPLKGDKFMEDLPRADPREMIIVNHPTDQTSVTLTDGTEGFIYNTERAKVEKSAYVSKIPGVLFVSSSDGLWKLLRLPTSGFDEKWQKVDTFEVIEEGKIKVIGGKTSLAFADPEIFDPSNLPVQEMEEKEVEKV